MLRTCTRLIATWTLYGTKDAKKYVFAVPTLSIPTLLTHQPRATGFDESHLYSMSAPALLFLLRPHPEHRSPSISCAAMAEFMIWLNFAPTACPYGNGRTRIPTPFADPSPAFSSRPLLAREPASLSRTIEPPINLNLLLLSWMIATLRTLGH